jgi:uncharacterized protein involved in type VI secretion and phage assembly
VTATLSLFETIRRIVHEEIGRLRTAELAIVQEQHAHAGEGDDDNYACTVVLRDSGIVLRRVPVATARAGLASIPAAGDLVLVQFVGGDVNAPVITGSLYNDEARPPVNADGQVVLHLPLGEADDQAVHLEVSSAGRREVVLRLGSGLTVQLQDDDPAVAVDVGGRATLTIDRDGAVTLESQGAISVQGREVKVEAQGTLTLKGATVEIN